MKYKILPSLAVSVLLLTSQIETHAQKNTAFAVTGQVKGNFVWNLIREIDLSTGEVLRTIYDPSVNKAVNIKAVAGTEMKGISTSGAVTGTGVAAMAYDGVHNRLYFTTMRGNNLLYFDFNSNGLNVVVNNNPSFNTGNKFEEGNVITRMAFASDGYGYAVTNDGKSLIRFTTDQKPTITNLGQLIDGKKNGTMSIHAQCSSWGGDMVGDTYGNLYLVSYRNHFFKINPQTRVADYLGQIKGLPADFTSNGMVVNNDGNLVVSSATMSDNYYQVNVSTLQASAVKKKDDKVFNCSDLANNNLLYQTKGTQNNQPLSEVKGNDAVTLYPVPAKNKFFNVFFEKAAPGKYNLLLTDALGRNVLSKAINITFRGQTERVYLPKATAGGVYMVKLIGANKSSVFNSNIVIE